MPEQAIFIFGFTIIRMPYSFLSYFIFVLLLDGESGECYHNR